MITRTELEELLTAYEAYVGRGKMDNAAMTLSQIIRSLADGILPPENTASHSNPPPCAPCDVSIPNNPVLIEDFKAPVVPAKKVVASRKKTAEPAPKTPRKPKAST